jgi:hypothetical protein
MLFCFYFYGRCSEVHSRWFPGTGFKHFAAEARKLGQDLVQVPSEVPENRTVGLLYIALVKQWKGWALILTALYQAEGTAQPSFVTNALADIADGSSGELITDIKEVAATMYGDTFPLFRSFLSLASELVPRPFKRHGIPPSPPFTPASLH